MKYTVKWNNGYWKVFNTETYGDVSIHNLYTMALLECKILNSKK